MGTTAKWIFQWNPFNSLFGAREQNVDESSCSLFFSATFEILVCRPRTYKCIKTCFQKMAHFFFVFLLCSHSCIRFAFGPDMRIRDEMASPPMCNSAVTRQKRNVQGFWFHFCVKLCSKEHRQSDHSCNIHKKMPSVWQVFLVTAKISETELQMFQQENDICCPFGKATFSRAGLRFATSVTSTEAMEGQAVFCKERKNRWWKALTANRHFPSLFASSIFCTRACVRWSV